MAMILLADDDASVRDLVKRALEADGHTVLATQDGLEALEVLGQKRGAIAALVSDVDMPGLDGVGLAGKSLALQPQLKVVLMSGFAGLLDKASSLDKKRVSAITKPFTLDAIKQAVKQALG